MGLTIDSATGLTLLNAQGDAGALPLPRVGDLERTAAKAGAITTSIEKVIQWGRYSSLSGRTVVTIIQ